jgi:proteasome lid subunit RPN8/RPN11
VIKVAIADSCARSLEQALRAAGSNEIGGVLAAEQVGDGCFLVVDLSIQDDGTTSNFVRDPIQHREFIQRFHSRMGHQPERFNYLGEWHSHPSYLAIPSEADIEQMQDLVEDEEQASTFLVLMVVKLAKGASLRGSIYAFRPQLAPVRGRLRGSERLPIQEEFEPIIVIRGRKKTDDT